MKNSTEDIITDLYRLDPSLREHDTVVREMVMVIHSHRPAIVPDEAFVRDLRQTLLSQATASSGVHKADKPVPGLTRWLVYLTPVAAMAVLILMLLPQQPVMVPVSTDGGGGSAEPEVGTMMVPEANDVGDVSSVRMMPLAEEDAAMKSFSALAEPMDSFALGSIAPGMVVPLEFLDVVAPSFLVVQVPERNGSVSPASQIIGVSQLLQPGGMVAMNLPVSRPMNPGETFAITLYRDDGDGVFASGVDSLVYDADGRTPLQQFFIVTPVGW